MGSAPHTRANSRRDARGRDYQRRLPRREAGGSHDCPPGLPAPPSRPHFHHWGICLTQVARVLWSDVGRAPSPAAGPTKPPPFSSFVETPEVRSDYATSLLRRFDAAALFLRDS